MPENLNKRITYLVYLFGWIWKGQAAFSILLNVVWAINHHQCVVYYIICMCVYMFLCVCFASSKSNQDIKKKKFPTLHHLNIPLENIMLKENWDLFLQSLCQSETRLNNKHNKSSLTYTSYVCKTNKNQIHDFISTKPKTYKNKQWLTFTKFLTKLFFRTNQFLKLTWHMSLVWQVGWSRGGGSSTSTSFSSSLCRPTLIRQAIFQLLVSIFQSQMVPGHSFTF